MTQVSVPSAPCFPATAALQIGAEPASPQRFASTTPSVSAARPGWKGEHGGAAQAPPRGSGRGWRAQKRPIWGRSAFLLGVLCKFWKTLASGLYLQLRRRHVSKINIVRYPL